ncbi:hypothetical protein EW146_g7190 [Bondarzewia mesenterica]|uniref:Uncharacterized protein n=1 Tax=Bondarzewia mesenterica TaxID=1095465 RepID=A0A4S4LNA8_9AGAM|nr:hypothetical protein EW146_g7190 [Bondarzewia mesenterica]
MLGNLPSYADVCVNNSIDRVSVFTFSIIASPTIRDTIFARNSPATLLRLSRTCRMALSADHAHFRHAFDITHLLSRYFPDPAAFRALQARTCTIVSGLHALDFLDRAQHKHVSAHSELEVCVSSDTMGEVGAWLQGVGYACAMNFTISPTLFILGTRIALVCTSGYDALSENEHRHFIARGFTLVFETCSHPTFLADVNAREPSLSCARAG